MTDATIFVRFTVPGFHRWAGAPARRSYLADRHRHLFHVEVRMMVAHDDREVEFHDLMDHARAIVVDDLGVDGNFGAHSCEMIGRELGDRLAKSYQRNVVVIVSEDNECGAMVAVTP
ncbi:hypothetical protein HAP48_0035105 [Bradyrhizobium septentrionale]|uniref:Uncharacterized protein n=1 Tax=Bradyrhizobium septentrionale TaxID=1404411 RepID=A0A974A1D1_9BRAD|nr:hypothetical protein [Bradyrhizobium septentrionale]UGY13763.1 hypothetical protein HAP48_0035105 [Bradyrhizobium septentrionale]